MVMDTFHAEQRPLPPARYRRLRRAAGAAVAASLVMSGSLAAAGQEDTTPTTVEQTTTTSEATTTTAATPTTSATTGTESSSDPTTTATSGDSGVTTSTAGNAAEKARAVANLNLAKAADVEIARGLNEINTAANSTLEKIDEANLRIEQTGAILARTAEELEASGRRQNEIESDLRV
ncbi:MAG: hypothetical protein OEZ14_12150, partial [Acidimicrobiia bacterium]|nr:hypothetical protein [Acidimicrobiia bacterium]